MTAAHRTLPAVVGATENALRALLERTLAPTAVPTYDAWLALSGVPAPTAAVDDLRRRGLLDADGRTTSGEQELAAARRLVAAATADLVDGLPEDDVATTCRVLDLLRSRARSGTSLPIR